ncbi:MULTISPECIES: DNA translocase FtsK [Brucella]|jgi:S-DNA-T family DNA segregation ATPase FtsK/SpoIIIE|uniref:DNA translocase FtsK n=1 Tax=Brucella/Ochrobactrum group TaxID=2826938 RepID=UPI0009A21DE4|nr:MULTISPECIES: DNA translocase FtsK [Brucella]MBK0019755.1 DNA translocase FtsK [Ochrobactrum sp. S45]MBK0043505.1 DNA translocase FtsK [Ochrobactrum sp. S46]MBO1024540.1 DNA translocase FtsK [Ochrobactrum sp. SD129]MQP40101.1 DNA translocase FtsK [Ochrobactrum sp. MYb237]QWK77459.1 DNA translocase FtsK [Ochrobactrum sp. BTU1]
MRQGYSPSYPLRDERISEDRLRLANIFRRQFYILFGLGLLALTGAAVGALATWNVADPSLSHATDNPVTNALGYPGAVFSDIAMQFFGLASVPVLLPLVIWSLLLMTRGGISRIAKRSFAWLGAALLFAAIASCFAVPESWPMPIGLGGVFGDMMLRIPGIFIGTFPQGAIASGIALVLAFPALWLCLFASGIIGRREVLADTPAARGAAEDDFEDDDNDDETASGGISQFVGAMTHTMLSATATFRRLTGMKRRKPREDEFGDMRSVRRSAETRNGPRHDPGFGSAPSQEPPFEMDDGFDNDGDGAPLAGQEWHDAPPQRAKARVGERAPSPKSGARIQREAQASFLKEGGAFEMPSLHYLAEPKLVQRDASLSKDALEQNARLLEGVLEDFGVRGEIINVKPGPVVTLYELEPAPGIKSSRVIGLADDIARSMSAIAARVAVVPGRNVIGIELPNQKREMVYLREMLASRDFEQSKAKLALALGKTINGEPVIADIAKMPHVLVAGTTGSGKSVAINTMILSLVYRMTPQECRLIMIDPKMLELSIYDGIPHLLTPVVTDPKKAVVALKWTVREMEDRYRKMSKVGVRNIDGFNQRVGQAQKKGEQIARTVQTGFDRNTGEAIYETEQLDLEPMPYIVVIIDEMADLMMVAGKDIEGTVQRLAQMARAAGIHVIMATQRPSVDVITGTIKANFPTRISFQVTSKIDSRTILGEQGAEQLLGQGDMLFMAGGGRIQRVHGPFVGDDEVERIVQHLKLQGVPEYLDAITEDEEEDEGGGPAGTSNLENSDDPYDQAVAVVLRDKKASTSYIQRRLGIGYNRAASIIERMEDEGIVGPANHAGKREILVPTGDDDF